MSPGEEVPTTTSHFLDDHRSRSRPFTSRSGISDKPENEDQQYSLWTMKRHNHHVDMVSSLVRSTFDTMNESKASPTTRFTCNWAEVLPLNLIGNASIPPPLRLWITTRKQQQPHAVSPVVPKSRRVISGFPEKNASKLCTKASRKKTTTKSAKLLPQEKDHEVWQEQQNKCVHGLVACPFGDNNIKHKIDTSRCLLGKMIPSHFVWLTIIQANIHSANVT